MVHIINNISKEEKPNFIFLCTFINNWTESLSDRARKTGTVVVLTVEMEALGFLVLRDPYLFIATSERGLCRKREVARAQKA